MIEQVTYKQVLNVNGALESVELWQGDQHITLSFAGKGTHQAGYLWTEVREVLDRLQEKVAEEILKEVELEAGWDGVLGKLYSPEEKK